MKLYHGSHVAVPAPLVGLGRKKVDFGQGFYLTKLEPQARSWAETIASRKGRNVKPVVSSYEFDYDAAISEGFRVMSFRAYNLEWLEYVIDCRHGGEAETAETI